MGLLVAWMLPLAALSLEKSHEASKKTLMVSPSSRVEGPGKSEAVGKPVIIKVAQSYVTLKMGSHAYLKWDEKYGGWFGQFGIRQETERVGEGPIRVVLNPSKDLWLEYGTQRIPCSKFRMRREGEFGEKVVEKFMDRSGEVEFPFSLHTVYRLLPLFKAKVDEDLREMSAVVRLHVMQGSKEIEVDEYRAVFERNENAMGSRWKGALHFAWTRAEGPVVVNGGRP